MDAQLAAIYGTGNEPEGNDLEKMAAAELLVKLAEEEGVDLSRFSDQEVAGMIADLYKQAEFPPKKDEGKKEEKKEEHEKGESPEKEKKEEEKVAEADFLGRVMAHSMVHELREIEKEAAEKVKTEKPDRGALTGVHKLLQRGGESKGLQAGLRGAAGAAAGGLLAHAAGGSNKVKALSALAGGATGAGLGALKAMSNKGKRQALAELSHGEKKKAASADESALEQLAQQAAFAMAKEAGYIDDEGTFLVQTQEKQASAVDQAVYARALQICEENGIPVEWNE